ncbi:MAG TPA: hypothetical protein VFM53_12580 [Anaeromyxobacteraceae bacterium]|nr:hypothetical protein [Anaeromyxobacteraceae bacterium]
MMRFPAISISAALALALAGCGSSSPAAPVAPTGPAGTDVVVQIQPPSATTGVNGSVPFTASVTGTADLGVTWSVQEGSTGGTVTTSGVYTAPAVAGTFHVVVTSHADPTKSRAAIVTVTAPPPPPPGGGTVAPAAVTLDGCGTSTFTATPTGSTTGSATWSVREGATGGSITSAGAYTAPSTAGTYHVVATWSDGSTAEATVTVGPEKVLSVAVTPASGTVSANGTLAFSATVTTTCGTFAAQ